MRTIIAYLASPILKLTGYRFSKDYRWGTTLGHRMVYRLVDTVTANALAAEYDPANMDKYIVQTARKPRVKS